MAKSSQVIELGSSDEEPEITVKKVVLPQKKSVKHPKPNAMVSIPSSITNIVKQNTHKNVNIKRVNTHQGSKQLKNPFANVTIKNVNGTTQGNLGNIQSLQMKVNQHSNVRIPMKNSVPLPHNKLPKVLSTPMIKIRGPPPRLQYTKNDLNTAKRLLNNVEVRNMNSVNINIGVVGGPLIKNNLRPTNSGFTIKTPQRHPMMKMNQQRASVSLPPEITVKKVANTTKSVKRKIPYNEETIKRKERKLVPVQVPTVELDDDDDCNLQSTSVSPKWYVHPDDKKDIALENNTEPEVGEKEMIEITIEDSPVKPPPISQSKLTSDLSIIIEDSPQKSKEEMVSNSTNKLSNKGEEMFECLTDESKRIPPSKKKLSFPKDATLIEVEVEFCKPIEHQHRDAEVKESNDINSSTTDKVENTVTELEQSTLTQTTAENINTTADINIENNKVKESDESMVSQQCGPENNVDNCSQISEIPNTATINLENQSDSETNNSKCHNISTNKMEMSPSKQSQDRNNTGSMYNDDDLTEFNNTYKEFIKLCFKMENSDDMKKIVEKKVKEYYRQVDGSFTNSTDFKDFIVSKIEGIQLNPDNLYLYIKDVVDELKMKRKSKKKLQEKEDNKHSLKTEESTRKMDRRSYNICKLEKTLRKLHRAINKLEEQEVDFDDDADSVYLLTDRYKARLVRVHAKLCQLTGTRMPSEPKITIDTRPGKPRGPALKLEKMINKKVPIGAPLPFPDYHDIVKCVREVNKEENLGWSEIDINYEARILFEECGRKLQKRRQRNEWKSMAGLLADTRDPADEAPELQRRLQENKTVAVKKENEVIMKYADRQNQLKLEAKEVEQEDMQESAPSSDDDDVIEIEDVDPVDIQAVLPDICEGKIDIEKQQEHISNEEIIDNEEKIDNKEQINDEIMITGRTNIVHEHEGFIQDPKAVHTDNIQDANDENKLSDAESESAQLKLVLSDDDENEKILSDNDSTTQSLLKVRVTDMSEQSDFESTIAISDTDSGKDTLSEICEVVSIENSSDSDSDNIDSQSEENTLLLHIEESSDGVVESIPETKNDNIAVDKDTVPFENEDVEMFSVNDVEISGNEDFTTQKSRSDGELSVKSFSDELSTTSYEKGSEKDTDTDGGEDQSLNKIISDDSNFKNVIDIGPTIIQGSIIGDSESLNKLINENSNSESMDIGPTIIQGTDITDSGFEVSGHSRSLELNLLEDVEQNNVE